MFSFSVSAKKLNEKSICVTAYSVSLSQLAAFGFNKPKLSSESEFREVQNLSFLFFKKGRHEESVRTSFHYMHVCVRAWETSGKTSQMMFQKP